MAQQGWEGGPRTRRSRDLKGVPRWAPRSPSRTCAPLAPQHPSLAPRRAAPMPSVCLPLRSRLSWPPLPKTLPGPRPGARTSSHPRGRCRSPPAGCRGPGPTACTHTARVAGEVAEAGGRPGGAAHAQAGCVHAAQSRQRGLCSGAAMCCPATCRCNVLPVRGCRGAANRTGANYAAARAAVLQGACRPSPPARTQPAAPHPLLPVHPPAVEAERWVRGIKGDGQRAAAQQGLSQRGIVVAWHAGVALGGRAKVQPGGGEWRRMCSC